jgi:hypothetical protein
MESGASILPGKCSITEGHPQPKAGQPSPHSQEPEVSLNRRQKFKGGSQLFHDSLVRYWLLFYTWHCIRNLTLFPVLFTFLISLSAFHHGFHPTNPLWEMWMFTRCLHPPRSLHVKLARGASSFAPQPWSTHRPVLSLLPSNTLRLWLSLYNCCLSFTPGLLCLTLQ